MKFLVHARPPVIRAQCESKFLNSFPSMNAAGASSKNNRAKMPNLEDKLVTVLLASALTIPIAINL